MATQAEVAWLLATAKQAQEGGHIWPAMAACEAADESGWGVSQLAVRDHNLFGCKQHVHPVYGTVNVPTREFTGHNWVRIDAAFVDYPDDAACFRDRMMTLRTMSTCYPSYTFALAADSPEEYVTEVSRTWSTDPGRAARCVEIFRAHEAELAQALTPQPQPAAAGESQSAAEDHSSR